MSQHYTRNTISTAAFCKKCWKETQHTVSDRKLGYCIPCSQRPIPALASKPAPQPGLFDEFDEQIVRLRGHR